MTDVVIPVKDLSRAKGRLQNILTPTERAGLVLAMLRDLLTTLNQCALGDIWLVACDEAVFDLGAEFGVHDIREHVSKGYNHGVSAGLQSVNAQNSVVILPADLPLAQPHDIAQLIKAGAGINPTVAIVPDRHNRGTNGLFLSAPNLITPDFGVSSLFNHKVAAAQLRISARVVPIEAMAMDIDSPEDLFAVAQSTTSNATTNFLASIAFGQDAWTSHKSEVA
jgi:2-phospho-L-lactate guanylyltransferase